MARPRTVMVATVTASALILGTMVAQHSANASPASTPSGAVLEHVIVVLRDQLSSTPVNKANMNARAARATSAQASVLSRLSGAAPTHVTHFAVGNAFSATVTADQAAALAADRDVASVVKDTSVTSNPVQTTPAAPKARAAAPNALPKADANGPNAVCPSDPAHPLLEPEALHTIHALTTDGSPNAQQLSRGAGVKVAYIADGIDPNNADFIRPDGSHVIVDYQDFSGDGPSAPSGGGEAFGDASAIAAQGTVVHDLSTFVNPAYPLPPGCNIRIVGVAPGASIVAIKAGGEFLTNSSILQSIDYAVRVDHVDVINESFGLNEFPDASNRNTIQLFNDAAVQAGVTITESSGDGGITGTIGSDAQDPYVISTGASTDSRIYAQTGYAGARAFGNGKWTDNNISALSSSGFTQYGRTIDLVAPGEADWAVCEPGFSSCVDFKGAPSAIQPFGGTSQSAPLTAGVAALVISAYRAAHGGSSPSPAVVKKIITGTTHDLGMPADEQGSGLLDARAATEAAVTFPGASTAAPAGVKSNIVTSTNQVTLTGNPGTTQQASVAVSNVGTHPLTVALGTRAFSTFASSTQTVDFPKALLPTFPYPTTGAPWAYKKVTFAVPSGTARLLVQTAWQGGSNKVLRVSLFGPDGTYVANSRPQGGAASPDYANVDVRQPAAGSWTAVLYANTSAAGFSGSVQFATTDQRAVPVGTVSPAVFTLAPGASQNVTFGVTLPSTASGDQSYAVTVASSDGHQTSVSAVVRTLIPTSRGSGTYTGVVTGGNARAVTPGETFSYAFDVPANKANLSVSLSFAHNPNSVVDLVLIDPNNELSDVVTNETLTHDQSAFTLTQNIQSFTAAPIPGRWQLVVVVQNPVSGADISQQFSGVVSFAGVTVGRNGLPNASNAYVKSGATHTYKITVHNPGVQPIFVGVDPRLNQFRTLQPVPISGQSTFALPPDPSQEPVFNIPPDTRSLTVAANSTTPAQLELQGSAAGFDLFGDLSAAQHGSSLSVASVSESGAGNYISRGIWFTNMQQIGPFTDAGAPPGETTITASMVTLAFDPAVTSSAGDPYGNAVDPANDGFGHPVEVAPGATASIRVTITAPQAKGLQQGVLNIVTVPNLPTGAGSLPFTTTGEVVATIPYEYTVH